MVRNAGFHRWRYAQRLMDATEIVVHEVQRHGMLQVLQLLAEAVGKPREAAHAHPHRQILALDKAGVETWAGSGSPETRSCFVPVHIAGL